MGKHTFTKWLHGEITSTRCALLSLYEQRDRLQYIEGPQLEKDYMDKVGTYEESVIKEEIACELLRKKQQMIRTAINRREPVDEDAIDRELEKDRLKMLLEAEGPAAPEPFASLSDAENETLQALYRGIVHCFHPQMHPESTEAHRQLFQRAQEAYRCRDLAALKLVHEMLFGSLEEELAFEQLIELLTVSKASGDTEEEVVTRGDHATDYALAAMIYPAFTPTEEEAAILENWKHYRKMTDTVMRETEDIRKQFPYTASDMLSDPAKIQAYKEELAHRLYSATAEIERRTEDIRKMIESVAAHA